HSTPARLVMAALGLTASGVAFALVIYGRRAEGREQLLDTPALVRDLNIYDVGVRREAVVPGSAAIDPGRYMPRDVDSALRLVLDRFVEHQHPRLIILRGPAACGKSRALLKALRAHEHVAEAVVYAPNPD